MSNPLDRLRAVKGKSDTKDQMRRAYQGFISVARNWLEWSDDDVNEYAESIKRLMTGSDSEVLAMFPDGYYLTANEAKESAMTYWQSQIDMYDFKKAA